MQWNGGPNSGFTTGAPWLPLDEDYKIMNVEAEQQDPTSMLSLYHRLIALRMVEPALSVGSYSPFASNDDLIAYVRQYEHRRLLVVLNLSSLPHTLEGLLNEGRVLFSTNLDREGEELTRSVALRPDEGVIIELF